MLPLMVMARKDPKMTADWNVSVHTTALIPPFGYTIVILFVDIHRGFAYDCSVEDANGEQDSAREVHVQAGNCQDTRGLVTKTRLLLH